MLKMICMAATLGVAASSSAVADELEFQGRRAQAQALDDGGFVLRWPQGERRIAAQPMRTHTASPMFDALFALAQQEMADDRVDAIRDPAFNAGKPVPCTCFETGERWPYVWTRDVSFAADLALARLEPQRTRNSLRFKLSTARDGRTPGLFVAQDTGSGGSWPISSDRVVWFLAARGLLDDKPFADEVWQALQATLAQDRDAVFDAQIGLYRGETAFLDWREQTYPDWTREDVRFIAESFALSTNVLHYQALRLAEQMARQRGDARAARYAQWADALRQAIDARFWDAPRQQYVSYLGNAAHPVRYAKVDLLGLSLGVLAEVFPVERARLALRNYPMVAGGSPVVWPQEAAQPIYHNRAIWPFVSAYALRASRVLDDAPRIALELQSLMRGSALAGSNMENYDMQRLAVHVEEGARSGPVVNSPRQLWSVAGYLSAVLEGVFGLSADGSVTPKLPRSLVPLLFGARQQIVLEQGTRRYVLQRPADDQGELLAAGRVEQQGQTTQVQLVGRQADLTAPPQPAQVFAPETPMPPEVQEQANRYRVAIPAGTTLYMDGRALDAAGHYALPDDGLQHVVSLTRRVDGLESLHSASLTLGPSQTLPGSQTWAWNAASTGRHRVSLRYRNANGPINTGVTAAVKRLVLECPGRPPQSQVIVMPHSVGEQLSTQVRFDAVAGQACVFRLEDGFNMSALTHFAQYTGGRGGRDGVVNAAQVSALMIGPAADTEAAP
ncbi:MULTISPECIES: Six-hairpin glycosidase-like protein [Xanthomonas]|uniref:Six-hairpin glycosidase-like protein n=1 Tax=Xanthomonas cucurbitae TaxID=56453 RepID=A0A2S7DUH7_9XANT|nr:Six-hairpin glycosidase-like protein [Xanthomonas cucurbitae]PPU77389.1 Six-hairpin glycosidase-like protein [Xanthomonas cucurbitae]QHG87170.1 Six-hairpin glycosidase-like protein [Xanthomonas cucurbitae]WDM66234.1 Six-hairpin glycosidase-like protein [Xanthomonas cucurbitae]WDM70112.1 Six-hairpin glycosidase-like protein [Xanthomonas cucurbitae]WDM77094.1 Six-hairpin glycosidase-like protein [Xanthomonas cucurbitae]